VSVLFLDVTGSTKLAQRLDPEEVHEVMDGALARFSAVVRAHGGSVLQYAGDSLLAAFGDQGAQEDDAERAVRAGLALLQAAADEAAAVLARHGHAGFGVRVGVHTGTVLLGGGVDEGGSIRGMTVNVAARMEQTAPPGGLRISHDTWRHVQGLFDVLAQPPLQVKGRDRPMATYLVRGALPPGQARPARGVQGVATTLLGRAGEVARLLQAVDAAAADGQARGCTLLAEAGLGKSRLLDELLLILEARTTSPLGVPRLLARAQPGGLGQPYRLLRDMLASRLQIADDDSADRARERFEQGLSPLLGTDGQASAHLLGQLIGLDYSASPHLAAMDPRQLRDRGQAAFGAVLQALAVEHGQPVLLLADDLHWADDASLDLLLQLMDAALPLVVVGLARPVLLDRRPAWALDRARHHSLLLQPLPPQYSHELAAALLQRMDPVPTELAELLTRQSGGNPYYMEELLKMLIDDGVVDIEGPRWQLQPGRLAGLRVPSTLAGVLQARLDGLAAHERAALQQASIVGHVFWDDALAALDARAPAALPALQRKALVLQRESSAFEGTAEEAFGHHLLHQVAYETVLKAQRREGHGAAARWLAARVSDRSGEHLATTALHFLQAGEGAQAARWLADAADHAISRFDNVTALAHAQTALAHAPSDDPALRWRLLLCGSRAADQLADRHVQQQCVGGLLALSAADGSPAAWRCRALYAQAVLHMRRGEMDPCLALIEQAVVQAAECGETEIGAQGNNVWLAVLRSMGRAAQARERALAGLALARSGGDRHKLAEIRLLTNLGLLDHDAGRYEAALDTFTTCLALARQHHQVEIQALLLSNLSAAELGLGDYPAALGWAEEAHAFCVQVGDRMQATLALINRGNAQHGLGQLQAARATLQEADAVLAAVGARNYRATGLCILGDLLLTQGDAAAARSAFEQARSDLLAMGLQREALDAVAGLACAWHLLGDLPRALAELQPLLAAAGPAVPQARPEPPADAPADAPGDVSADASADATADALIASPHSARTLWLAHQVLAAAGAAEAPAWLQRAHAALRAQAGRIGDPVRRQRFLDCHVEARAVLGNWRAAAGGA
jgi:class 3 adenylate cyclase/tetratricopeptide (TPR) repeat protein